MGSACLMQLVMFKNKRFEKASTKQTFFVMNCSKQGFVREPLDCWSVWNSVTELFRKTLLCYEEKWVIDFVWHKKKTT